MKIKKVLSLFNGMGCARIALDQAGIGYDTFYSSEVDKYANKVADAIYPDNVQLGDVTQWQDWAIDWGEIDLIVAGFPCQAFSFAGKQLAFDDARGKLFFTLMEILRFVQSIKPDVKFLFENVKMKEAFVDVINETIGVEPVLINSALVSAQNRKRNYWANWKIEQPQDRGILLYYILEDGVCDRDKAFCIDANYHKGGNPKQYFNKSRRQLVFKDRSALNDVRCAAGMNPIYTKNYLQFDSSGKGHASQDQRIYYADGKHASLSAAKTKCKAKVMLNKEKLTYRKLTVRECARLQTIPEPIIDTMLSCGVSNSQLYKIIGNGWTIDVITHILEAKNK